MSYQLPPLSDEYGFEMLVRDLLRRVYDDPGVERFGRRGQAQHGIDGFSPSDSSITFQCKLKDIRYESDERLRNTLLAEMEAELGKTKGLARRPRRFFFATTFKNDAKLQQKAAALSDESLTVEYWGWDTINEKIWEYPESLIPTYYPTCPVRRVAGFRNVTLDSVAKAQTAEPDELDKLAIEYYRINDRGEVVFRVVCNDLDVRNDLVMEQAHERLESLTLGGTLWILGNGGCGKTTVLHRLALELARRDRNVYILNLETHLSKEDLEAVFGWIKYCSTFERTVLCVDNPAADEEALEAILRRAPDHCPEIRVVLAERGHRYQALRNTGCLTYLHGEEEGSPVVVRNTRAQRQKVYDRLFTLLGLSEADASALRDIALNGRLVYVNATYSILLELKRRRRIDFDFDWDDYAKTTQDLLAFSDCYKYIALFYLFGVRTPFTVLCRIFGADETQRQTFLARFRGLVNEPVIVDEYRDEQFRKSVHVRTKHEIVSEIFFKEHPELDRDELLREWCEHTDFADPLESQALINMLGSKKNYAGENPHVNFHGLIDFLLTGYLREKVAQSQKLYATLHLAKFWSFLLRDEPDKAVAVLEAFLQNVPEDFHCRTELAKAYQKQGKLAEAEAILLKILELRPEDLNSRIELAKICQRHNKLAEAESVLLKVLELDARNIQAYTELAKVYQKQNQLADAEAALLTVLSIKANDLNSRTELAKVYQRQGRLVDAEAVLLRLLELEAEDLQARTELAKIYQRQGRLGEAEAVLLRLLELEANDLQARTELAKVYQRQGKLDEAEAVLLRLLELDPNNLQARTELAKVYQRQGKLDEAIRRLEEYIALEPKGLHPRTELAKVYQRRGKLSEAEAVLLRLLELEANDLQARTELAKVYQRQGKLDEAEAVLLESLKIDERQLHPRTELAKIYQRQGRLDEAIRRLKEELELDPKALHPRTELAKIYQRQGKLDKAAERAEEVLAIDPLNDHAISELLGVWRRQGEKAKCARRFFEFMAQPDYRFSRYSQAPIFRFFQCCRTFELKEYAEFIYKRFESELDERNREYYQSTFGSK